MRGLAIRPEMGPMTPEAIEVTRALTREELSKPQVDLQFEHDLHAGLYARTMIVPELPENEACIITAALIKLPTLLISHGEALVYIGEPLPLRLSGHRIIRAAAGRRQVYIAASGFRLTMIFPTNAKTVEEAENEFTDEAHMLQTRRA